HNKHQIICYSSMQAKQKSLLERVDALDEECEELQRQLGEKEERQTELHNQLQQMSEEKEQQQAKLTQQQEKQTLETRIAELKNNVAELKEHVHACKDRERLLVAFPELSPLSQAQPQSTGNVILDMEQQLQANCLRIQVLEQENTALQSSLVKLKERAQYDASKVGHVIEIELEATGGESGLESAGSKDSVSTATSPSSIQIHLKTLHLSTGSAAAKGRTKAHTSSFLFHSRGLNQRKK
uniref:Coiled-coil domain containing 157 n=1 Tax=Sphaeramia orbicularis TaxID=375764 RepID=A0A672YQJ4_9TELE